MRFLYKEETEENVMLMGTYGRLKLVINNMREMFRFDAETKDPRTENKRRTLRELRSSPSVVPIVLILPC